MKRFVLFLLVSPFLLLSCEKETVLTLDQAAISFTDAGGSQDVSLTANKPWTVSSNQSWCKVSPSGGEEVASSRVTITCDANTSYDERSCTVTFTCAELTKTVSVTQATNNGLLVSQTSYELTKAAQQLNIEVRANVKFSVDVDASCKDWITYNTTKGLTANTVVLDIAENKSYDSREGKVTIKQNGGNLSSTITIKQSQLDGLFISTPEYNLSNEKHTLTVEVSTNVEFDVTSEADWVKYVQTKGLNSKQIILEVAENDTYDQRETMVNVKQKNGDIRGTIIIKQDEKYGILVTQSEYNLSNEAQTIEVEVKYNVDFDVIMPSECKTWIKQVSTKSLDSKTYSLSISQNKTYDNREGSITFKQKNGDISTTVAVKQAQTDYLEVVKNEYIVDIEGETISIDIQSNVDYSVALNEGAQSWLSIVETKGISKNQVLIAVASGDDNTDRKGMVIISYGNLKRTVMIHQYSYAANTIIQFADEKIKAKLVEAFDTNKDGEISIKEARAVKTIEGVFGSIKTYKSFDEFQFFTGVSTIPASLFEDWRIASIVIPESVETIEGGAFLNCSNLVSIIIPDGVVRLSSFYDGRKYVGCFEGCSGLSTIDLPESVKEISSNTFKNCENLVSVKLPTELDVFGSGVFHGCTHLKDVIIPRGINRLEGTFYGCSSLESVIIPEWITECNCYSEYLGSYKYAYFGCFEGCTKLKNISIPPSCDFGSYAFRNCPNLTSVSLPQATKWISRGMFDGCSGLISVKTHDNLMGIMKSAFSGCEKLESIYLPEGMTSIGEYAFYQCRSLASIIIPESVTDIGPYAFSGCSKLTSVSISENVTTLIRTFEYCRSLSSVGIPESVTTLDGTFCGCSSLTSISIPESVTSLGYATFADCSSLTSITIPDSVTSIGSLAFARCSGLISIIIPESVTNIEKSAFSDCTGLTSITIPKSITNIGESAFSGCSGLTSITIPESVTSIGNSAFYGCSGLTSITILEGVKSIGYSAFSGCSGLTSITIPESVTSIGNYAFYDCTGLTSITIPKSITNIGESAFSGCSGLITINIPEGVTSIGYAAFSNCGGLTSITIPKSVTSIGDFAFYSCNGLTAITILCTTPPTLKSNNRYTFSGFYPIYVPAGSVEAYKTASNWGPYAGRIQAIL